MIDQPPEHIDPLKIAAQLLNLKDWGGDHNDAPRLGAVAIRLLFDENAKLKRQHSVVWADDATPFDGPQVKSLLDENADLRALVKAQDKLLSPRSDYSPQEALDAIRELKAKLGLDKAE